MASCYSSILLFVTALLLPSISLATIPVVTPVNGSHQVAVLPNSYSLTFTISPPVPPNNITWYYRSHLLTNVLLDESSDPFISFSSDRVSLNLLVPTKEGEYILEATNENGTGSGIIVLDVKSEPAFQTVPTSQMKHEHQNVTFSCFPTGDPTPTIEWIYNSSLIINTTTDKYRVGQFGEPGFGSLTVYNLLFTDTGDYVCRATNVYASLDAPSVHLGVQVLPSITSQPLPLITPPAGGVANITCSIRGFPPAYITWQKNGVNLTDINSISTYSQLSLYDHSILVTTSILTVTGPVLSTNGNYTCTGSNNLMSFERITSEETQLFVQYPPSTEVSHETVRVNQTFPTSFYCSSFGIPLPSLHWYTRGNRVEAGSQITLTTTNFTNGTDFLIRRVELNIGASSRTLHEGNYTCVAVNGISNLISTPENVTTELLVQVPPRLEYSRSILGVVTRPITLTVQIINDSPKVIPTNIHWYYNNSLIINSDEYLFSADRKSLTISSLTHSREGVYTIIASNEAGTDTGDIALQIEAAPVIILPPLMTTNVLQDNIAVLNCTISAEPQPTVQWSRDTVPVNQTSPNVTVSFTNGSNLREYMTTLTIYNVTMGDTGDYTCTVFNTHGRTNTTGHIEVQVPPHITLNPTNITSIRHTSNSSLSCQAFGSPTPNITWIKGGVAVNPLTTPTISVTSSVTGFMRLSTINFLNLSFNDADLYMCLAQNDLVSLTSTHSNTATLTVNQSPLLVSVNVSNIINQSQTVNMSCSYLGLPPPIITWSRSHDPLNDTLKFNIYTTQTSPSDGGVVTSSILQVTNVGDSDSGNYSCTASNNPYGVMGPVNMSSISFPVLVQTSPIVTRVSSPLEIGVLTRSILLSFKVSRDTPLVEPSRDIRWFFNDTEILVDNNKYTLSNFRRSLTISNLTLQDEGTYTLMASNIIGSGNDSVFVDVEVSPVITGDSGVINIVKGGNAILHCAAVSEPVHITSWWFNNTLIATNTSKYTIYGNNTVNSSLMVNDVSIEDEGRYTCRASNVHGNDSAMPLLQVQVPPIITTPPTSTITLVNNITSLHCCASGRPLPDITWFKNDTLFDTNITGLSITISQQGASVKCSTLTIHEPVFTDRGNYSCKAVNFLAETISVSSQSETLTVQYPPQVYPTSQGTYIINQSDSFTIQCSAFGIPTPTIYWLPGPVNITNEYNNGNQLWLNSHIPTLRTRIANSRLLGLTDQCPSNDGPSQCRGDTMNVTNDCSINGSLCTVPCGVVITNSYDSGEEGDRPLVVSILTICGVMKSDQFSYSCLGVNNISNTINTPEAVSVNLIVQVPPTVISAHIDDSQIAFRGHNTTLHFNITNSSPDVLPEDIYWSFTHRFHRDRDMTNISTGGSGNHYIFSSDRRSLTIVNLTTDDSGTYILSATNPAGINIGTVQLLVQALPEIILFPSSPIITTTDKLVTIDCFADGSPLQNVSWSFTNITGSQIFVINFIITNETGRTGYTEYLPLVPGLTESSLASRFSISNNTNSSDRLYGRLTIRNINPYDAGIYQCTLINEFNIHDPESRSIQVDVQLNATIEQSPSLSTNCITGGSCILNCTFSGVPSPVVAWYHNGQLLSSSLATNISTYDSTLSVLTISSTDLSNSGSYYCVGSNVLYSNTSDLSVNGIVTVLYPPQVIIPPVHTTVNETFNTTLHCTITGYPLPVIEWFIGSTPIITTNSSKYIMSMIETSSELLTNVTSSLLIVNVTKNDEMTYRCTGNNGVINLINVQNTATTRLTVQVSPTVIRTANTSITDVVKGTNLTISFNITRASPLVDIDDIIWTFKDLHGNTTTLNITCADMGGGTCNDTQRYSRYNFTFDSLGTSLEIRNAQVMDYGQYSVTAGNPAGISVGIHNLVVNVSAQLSTITDRGNSIYNYTRNIGGSVNITLNCTADGIPTPNILWYLDSTIVSETRRITITQRNINTIYRSDVGLHPNDNSIISILSIINADPLTDAGLYTCEADNRIGQPSLLSPPFNVIITVETIDRCLNNPCQNGGTCFNTENSFFCECGRDGNTVYDGERCEDENRIPIPPYFTRRPQAQFIRLFDPVVLNCAAEGEPTPIITWYKNGDPISGAVGSESYSYSIPEVTLSHRGRYHCTARNANGQIVSDSVLVNIIDVVEYDANLTITIDRLFANTLTRNVTTAVNEIVTEINRGNAGNKVGDNSTVFFIERSGSPINLTANFTLPIRVTIRIVQGRMVDDALRTTVENAVAMFGYLLDINGAVTIFNYCPPDVTIIPSPDGNPDLAIRIQWPRQILGLSQAINCPCDFNLSTTALVATRNCTGDFTSGALWERPDIRDCNFSVTTRELCSLATLPSSDILKGLDRITSGNVIDSAGTAVTSFAMETVQSDVMDNMTLVDTSMNVFNNILGVNNTVLEMAQSSSGSSTRMQNSLFNITRNLPPNTMIMRDRMMITTGNSTPSVLTSNITTGNTSQDTNNTRPPTPVSITLPPEVTDVEGTYSLTAFSNDGLYIPRNGRGNVVTPVIDFTKHRRDGGSDFNNLAGDVVIGFDVSMERLNDPTVTPRCVFWDVKREEWSGVNCTRNGSSCSCNHLTSFAILLDVAADEPRVSPEDEAFEYITYIGLTISTVSLIITLITYLGSPKLRSSEASQLLINLCFALLGLYISFMIAGQGVNLTKPICSIVGVLVHYFFLTVFFIMAAESIDLFIKLVIVLGPKIHKFILKTIIIAWIAPLFFVLFSFVPNYEHYVSGHFCGPTQVPLYVGMILPFCIIYIFNWTIFSIIMISLLRKSASSKFNEAKKKNRKAEVKQQCRVAFTVSVLFGLGWGFGLLSTQAIQVLAIRIIFNAIFTVLTTFQGFFIFLLYVLLSPNARKVWKRWILRRDDKPGESTSSAGHSSATRSTKNTSLTPTSRSSRYGNNARTGTLYKNVYSAASKKTSSPYVTRDMISSGLESTSAPVMEELKGKLQFRSLDSDDDRVFMNPFDDLGDVMSLVSDNGSLLGETTFSFPNPNPLEYEGNEEEEERDDDMADVEEGKCSTFKNPLRATVRIKQTPKEIEETELLSGNTVDEEPSAVAMVTLNLSDINGFAMSDEFSPSQQSLSPTNVSNGGGRGYSPSQGLSANDGSFLIKDSQVSDL